MGARPDPKAEDWVAAQDIRVLFLSVVSIGELEAGFTTMRTPRGAQVLRRRLRVTWHSSFRGVFCR